MNKNNKFWQEFSGQYDNLVGEEGDKYHRLVINPLVFKLLGNLKGKIVLDAGCGNGYLSRIMAKTAKKVVGADFTPQLIELAKKRSSHINNLEIIYANLEELPLKKNFFDSILCNMVLINVENLKKVITELSRVLKNNGSLVVSITHPCFENPPYTPAIKNKQNDIIGRSVYSYFPTGLVINTAENNQLHYHYLLSDYINNFAHSGFLIEEMIEPNDGQITGDKNPTPLFLLIKFIKPGKGIFDKRKPVM